MKTQTPRKKHAVYGDSFHNGFGATFIGPAQGFVLSRKQARRWERLVCPFWDCECPGVTKWGPRSARIVPAGRLRRHHLDQIGARNADWDDYVLIPAHRVEELRDYIE